MLLLFSTYSFSQEDKRPMYVSVTTMYWNSNSDMTMDEWKAGEKEYMEKVTKKNEYIMWAGYFTHLMTPNSNEVIYGQTYPNWEAIEKAAARNAELEKVAWPDEATRKAFLDKMGSAYATYHSDEIYATLAGAKTGSGELPDGAIMYMRKNKRAFPEDGSAKELGDLSKKMLDEVIKKNDYIKGYYPSQHAWGSDRRDFIQVFYLNSLGDLDKMFDKNSELMKAAFTKEEAQALGKYTKSHGDYVYSIVKL
ncbi:hypothetical protein GCM10007962_14710 [Yeosuana aromativorans]|uniref:Uncharacterized protein n=2 Tax=Yeosuana aromativorans TaxID=288019 RepID=A0A8J3FIZ8_9FLAO|nr:hypothetical protein GCM10007962_14710 [Yeosuana aromativorans]